MKPFLEKIADRLLKKFPEKMDGIAVVLPSKRSVVFLKKYLSEKITKPIFLPQFYSIEEFIEKISELKVIDNVSLQFYLYKSYLKVKEHNEESFNDFLNEEDQFNLSKIFMKQLGFDFSRGRIDKSLHPFCGGGTQDVRITTRFSEEDSFSCFDALMHETGHALYEQGLPKKWAHQPVGSAGGMSLHESQSLFIEMQIIKSLPVSQFIQKTLEK